MWYYLILPYLTLTLGFKDHWPHDLHDLPASLIIFLQSIKRNRTTLALIIISEHREIFPQTDHIINSCGDYSTNSPKRTMQNVMNDLK